MKKQTFDLIFGIGAACPCSLVLRKCRLQYNSYPFDWNAGGTFMERVDMLCNHFNHFLDLSDLKDTGDKYVDHEGPRTVVYNRRTHVILNHDFPANLPIKKSYPAILKKYTRRIDRLFQQISESSKILIVYQEPAICPDPLKENNLIMTAWKKLQKKFSHAQIHLLYISNDASLSDRVLKNEDLTPFIRKVTMNYKSKKDEADWAVNEKLVKKVYKNIRLKKTWDKILKEEFLWWISYLILFRAMRRRFLRKFHFYI